MKIKRRKTTFVLVIPSFEDFFHSYYAGEIIKGVSLTASRLKIDVLIHITDRFDHRGWLDSSLLDRNFIDGIVFADIDNDVHIVKKAINRGIPTFVLNNLLREPINCINTANDSGTNQVMEHLFSLGHKRIATIAGDLTTQAGVVRLGIFQQAMAKKNLEIPKSYIAHGDFMRTAANIAAKKLLKLRERPTAIFAASDVMALEVMDVAKSFNISVPEELSVVGFDDNPMAINSPVPLTTVSQPLAEMGRIGTEQLFRVSQGKAQLPVKMTLPTKLVVRKSTAAAKE